MRVPINLASQPYQNLRPLYSAAGVALALLVLLAMLVSNKMQRSTDETRLSTQEIQRLDGEMVKLRQEQLTLKQWLGNPQVQEIRDHSTFLNSLIARKSLSWTKLFMDLEKVLPDRVQVVAIRPSMNESERARLNLTLAAPAVEPLVEFLKKLESSPQFSAPVVDAQRFPAEKAQDPNIVLELSVSYRQGSAAEASSSADDASPSGDEATPEQKEEQKEEPKKAPPRAAAVSNIVAGNAPKGAR